MNSVLLITEDPILATPPGNVGKQFAEQYVGGPAILKRLRKHQWVVASDGDGEKGVVFNFDELKAAVKRMTFEKLPK